MSEIGDKIRAVRKSAGLTQGQLAKKIGVPLTTLATWEQGKSDPSHRNWLLLKKALDLSFDDFEYTGLTDDFQRLEEQSHSVQVLGYVGAGGEVTPIDDHAMGGGLEEVECPPDAPKGTVAVIVQGDSMYPLLNEGSIIYFSKRERDFTDYYHRLVIAHFKDGRKAVKGLTPGSKKGYVTLTSTNKAPMVDMEIESVSPIDWIKPI